MTNKEKAGFGRNSSTISQERCDFCTFNQSFNEFLTTKFYISTAVSSNLISTPILFILISQEVAIFRTIPAIYVDELLHTTACSRITSTIL